MLGDVNIYMNNYSVRASEYPVLDVSIFQHTRYKTWSSTVKKNPDTCSRYDDGKRKEEA